MFLTLQTMDFRSALEVFLIRTFTLFTISIKTLSQNGSEGEVHDC